MKEMTHRFTVSLRRLQRDMHDWCSRCGKRFKEGETAHAGYTRAGEPIYVGDCCAEHVEEVAARIYWQPLGWEVPRPEVVLWRYMDFSKLLAILMDRTLWFARADTLGDPFEGARGLEVNRDIWERMYLDHFKEAIRTAPTKLGSTLRMSEESIEKEARRLLSELSKGSERELKFTYVSCWHENEGESEALWRLYCPVGSAGLAIQTTKGALQESLSDPLDITIGRVKYLDFNREFSGVNDAIFRKRKSLMHECEVRAVFTAPAFGADPAIHPQPRGIAKPVVVSKLIKQVVVSPFAPGWFAGVLHQCMRRFDAEVDVMPSDVLQKPFY